MSLSRLAYLSSKAGTPRPLVAVFCTRSYSQSFESLRCEVHGDGSILSIGINRPQAKNAVNPQTATELAAAIRHFEDTPELKVGILHGVGNTFCAGFDLKELSKQNKRKSVELHHVGHGDAPMGPSRFTLSKPIIAAIEGYAVAGGLELACLCDLRVASHDSTLGVFCRKVGVPLIDGGTVRLPKLIGLSHALDLIITGRAVSGEEAKQMGLVNFLSEPGCAFDVAFDLAQTIAQHPQQCLRRDISSCYYSTYSASSLHDALDYEFRNGIPVVDMESIAGAQQFVKQQKRRKE
eukprot:m.298043 g.298043  ORF g.298043 m.298043 type:complete len:293 (+) comp15860_c0_seq1:145-1023(+)